MADGGFNLTQSLLENIPVFNCLLTEETETELINTVSEMINKEEEFIVTKMNAGKLQENIKFPEEYVNRLNKILLNTLEINVSNDIFKKVHNNYMF